MKYTALLILCLLAEIANAQFSTIIKQQSIGCVGAELIHDFILDKTDYVIAGSTGSYTPASCPWSANGTKGSLDGWVAKLDSNWNMVWSKTYGGSLEDYFSKIITTSEGGYIIAGYSSSVDGDITNAKGLHDIWILRLNVTGDVVWKKSLGSSKTDLAFDVIETNDNNFLVVGSIGAADGDFASLSFKGGVNDAWVVKLSPAGNIIWQKNYGGSARDIAKSITKSKGNSYFIVCSTNSTDGDVSVNKGFGDIWLYKIDGNGNLLSSKTFGGSGSDEGSSIYIDNNNDLLIGGTSTSKDADIKTNYGDKDAVVLKVDSNFNPYWIKNYGGSCEDFFHSIIQSKEGGYIFTLPTQSADIDAKGNHGAADILVVKVNDTGKIEWNNVYGGSSGESGSRIYQQADSTYVLGCINNSKDGDVIGNNGSADGWLIRLGRKPLSIPTININKVSVYPTITKGIVYVSIPTSQNEPTIRLYDLLGKEVNTTIEKQGNKYEVKIHAALPSGVYVMQTACNSSIIHLQKIIYQP